MSRSLTSCGIQSGGLVRRPPHGRGSVLLGRPWLYDFDVAQYGRANRCVFYFGGTKHVWQPYVSTSRADESSAAESTARSQAPPLLGLVTAHQFIKGLENDAPMWAVQVRTKVSTAPADSCPAFLREFVDIFPTELPEMLPPDRTI